MTIKLRTLPKLPEEFNRNYVVQADTIDRTLLKDSGYSVLHRPYFAMKGSTHDNWMLNPHTRSGVDAAKKDEPAISFDEFLALFETAEYFC